MTKVRRLLVALENQERDRLEDELVRLQMKFHGTDDPEKKKKYGERITNVKKRLEGLTREI